jgi:hypothetical protein
MRKLPQSSISENYTPQRQAKKQPAGDSDDMSTRISQPESYRGYDARAARTQY